MALMLEHGRIRVYGPPGTGKTHWLQEEVDRLLAAGVPGEDVVVLSFSRAAFGEFASRLQGQIPDENMGTVHSMAYRLIGRPLLALASQLVETWNEQAPPVWHLTPRVRAAGRVDFDVLDPLMETDGEGSGDILYNSISFLRNTRAPDHAWPPEAVEFWRAWNQFMQRERAVDFPGMLEAALATATPLGARYILVDEAQDLNALQIALIERWSTDAHLALIGDDDQAIYGFMGANGVGFLEIPVDHEYVLEQSYRVPRRIHAVANAVAHRITQRAPKTYHPRDEEGTVHYASYTARSAGRLADEALARAASGQSVLILASTKHFLDPIKNELRARGEPYANPYAPYRSSFNTFSIAKDGQPSGWERVRAFFYSRRLVRDVQLWARYIKAEAFVGKKSLALQHLSSLPKTTSADDLGVLDLFAPEHRPHIVNRNPVWLVGMLEGSAPQNIQTAAKIALRNPSLFMSGEARVWLGTIHSVKGGEADVVFVIPSLTRRWMNESPDVLHRLFYVAITRAKKELILLDRSVRQAPYTYYWPLVDGGD